MASSTFILTDVSNSWSSIYSQPLNFGTPTKKWKSSTAISRNNIGSSNGYKSNYKSDNASAVATLGRSTSPIRIKLIPYSSFGEDLVLASENYSEPTYGDNPSQSRNNFTYYVTTEDDKGVVAINGAKSSSTNRIVVGEASTPGNGCSSEQQGRSGVVRAPLVNTSDARVNNNSSPPKLSCSPSSALPNRKATTTSNNNNNGRASTTAKSTAGHQQPRQNFFDKAAIKVFHANASNFANVDKPTSSSSSSYYSTTNPAKLRAAKSESSLRIMSSSQSTTLLSDRDIEQVEMMYSSQDTKVFVCTCLANLYFNNAQLGPSKDWELIVTGVPVVVLNCGEKSRSRSTKQLLIILAERGTGFTLWKEVINDCSHYEEVERTFHTLVTSCEPTRLAGLSFDNVSAASKFYQHVKSLFTEQLDANHNFVKNRSSSSTNALASGPATERYTKKQRRHSFVGGSKKMILRKAEISTPVCFKHITSVKPADLNPVIVRGGDGMVPKRAQSCVQILTIGDGNAKSIQ